MMITRPLLNACDLASWARGEGFRDLRPDAWHVSLARVKFSADRPPLIGGEVVVEAGLVGPVRRLGAFWVVTFESGVIRQRHAQLLEAGATWDHRTFRPHVTFAVGSAPDRIADYVGSLVFGPETLSGL